MTADEIDTSKPGRQMRAAAPMSCVFQALSLSSVRRVKRPISCNQKGLLLATELVVFRQGP